MSVKEPVVIVGAGVIGLSVALVLSEEGYTDIQILGAQFPTDPLDSKYTSSWAGAHFRPFPSANEKEFEESKLTRLTLEYFKKLTIESPEASIKFVEGVDYLEKKGIYEVNAKGYYEGIEQIKEIPSSQLPDGVEYGASYKTWVLNAPIYLNFLYRKLAFHYGVKFQKTQVKSLKQVAKKFPGCVIVNASGMGLKYDGGYDSQCYSIRGQTLLVRAPAGNPYENKTVTHQSKDGKWTFVIQRPLDGGFILGGTKQLKDSQKNPKPEDTKELIERGKVLYPELFINGEELDIRNINVGFRPARAGGSRIEIEKRIERGNEVKIVHAYGFGGMGFEMSYGAAQKVHNLLHKQQRSKL